VIDLQNNETSTTFDQNLLQEIPSGRDPWSTVAQMPGSTLSTFDVAGNNSLPAIDDAGTWQHARGADL